MGIATKWPRLLVVGDNVTPEQADEILIRTNSWYLFSNDKGWERTVRQLAVDFGCPVEPDPARRYELGDIRSHIEAKDAWKARLGILELGYLHNWQIMSAWFGGPHGWCDWDGNIGCSTFNIGKWPSSEGVTEDWQAIATAFPYLNLRAQCVEEEGEGVVAGTWTVTGGEVTYEDGPADRITDPTDYPITAAVFNSYRERGVDYPRLRRAFQRVAGRG